LSPLDDLSPLLLLSPPLSLLDDDGLPLSLLGGFGLLSLGGVGLLSVGGALLLSVPGGGFVVGGVDCVGQLALASITDPSGHVFVAAGGGVNVCVHEGSFGLVTQDDGLLAAFGHAIFVGSVLQFTEFCGLPVQLPAAQVVPFPPPDAGVDVLLGCIAADVLLAIFPAVVVFVALLL
jgi:hypothetical protein